MTGYTVHYSDGSTDRSMSVAASSTSADITGLTNGRTYSISVEATSEHLSGKSDPMTTRSTHAHHASRQMYTCNV